MHRKSMTTLSALAASGAIILGGAGVASAADRAEGAQNARNATRTASDSAKKGAHAHRGSKPALTDAQKEKASTAALAEVPGTVDHVRAGRDGGYVVIVTATDGTKTAVKLDKDFKVTGTQTAKDRATKGTKDATGASKGSRDRSRTSTGA